MGEGPPDLLLLHLDELVIVDNVAGRIYLLVYANPAAPEAYSRAQERLKSLRIKLRKPVDTPYSHASVATQEIRRFAKDDYLAAVRKAKAYIEAGDLMQVQIGQVIVKPFSDSPLSLYRALRSLNPSPYMYFWNFGDFKWWVHHQKSWCDKKWLLAQTPPNQKPKSRSDPWQARASAAPHQKKMPHWLKSFAPIRRSVPSM